MGRFNTQFALCTLLCTSFLPLHAKIVRKQQESSFLTALTSRSPQKTRSLGALCPCPETITSCFCRSIKFLPFRSLGYDKTRQIVGMAGHVNQYKIIPSYATFTMMLEYNTSFRSGETLRTLFGSDIVQVGKDQEISLENRIMAARNSQDADSIIIQGSDFQKNNRHPNAWFADYFYLPINYQSIVSFKPKFSQVALHFDFYIGLDGIIFEGIYFRAYGPLVHAHWNMNIQETIVNEDEVRKATPIGYFATDLIVSADLVQNFIEYIGGAKPFPDDITDNVNQFGLADKSIIFQPLNYARMSRAHKERTAVGDVNLELGWNFIQDKKYYLGAYLIAVAPASPKRDARYLINPVIGNNGHWEIGLGISASQVAWAARNNETHFSFNIDARATHAFNSLEQRTLELIQKPNSAYMLAAKFGINGEIPNPATPGMNYPKVEISGGAIPTQQFALEYAPVANLTTVTINTSQDIKADVTAALNFTTYGIAIDMGYNFWTFSRDRTKKPGPAETDSKNGLALTNASQADVWALKGDARMFGYIDSAAPESPVPLSATQTVTVNGFASIHNGKNQVLLNANAADINENVDNAANAVVAAVPGPGTTNLINDPTTAAPQSQIRTSVTPVFLTVDDLDFAHTRGMSHKIFMHAHYTRDGDIITPHLGIGGFVEFGINNNMADNSQALIVAENRKIDVALSYWGIWLKGGFTFN